MNAQVNAQLLSDYCFIHYNYKYDWLRPTVEEIVETYKKSTVSKGRTRKTLRPRIRLIQRKNLMRRKRETRRTESSGSGV